MEDSELLSIWESRLECVSCEEWAGWGEWWWWWREEGMLENIQKEKAALVYMVSRYKYVADGMIETQVMT